MKKYIPNILTTYRLIVAFLIPILFFNNHYNLLAYLFIIALLSDLIDGYLARKWNVISNYGKIVDALGDKLLSLIASATFIIIINKSFLITLILEVIIAIINIIKYIKKGILNNNSSIYGKIKTWFLFVSLLIGLLSFKYAFLNNFLLPFIIVTAIFQILAILSYLKKENL